MMSYEEWRDMQWYMSSDIKSDEEYLAIMTVCWRLEDKLSTHQRGLLTLGRHSESYQVTHPFDTFDGKTDYRSIGNLKNNLNATPPL